MRSNDFAILIWLLVGLLHSLVLTPAANAAGRNPYDLPEPVAIQHRKYQMNDSLFLNAGYIPTDSFNRGFTFSTGYRHAFQPWLTWEVINYTQVANKETQLKNDLSNLQLDVKNVGLGGVFDWPKQIYMTGLHYSPFYSKSLMFNSSLVYSEMSFFFGGGALNFNTTGIKPMIAPGLATRIYFSESFAFNAFFRNYFYQDDAVGINGILDFGMGIEWGFKLFGGGS